MKVVYFIDHLRADGTQRVLQQLVAGLAERGHQQAVVCLNDSWDSHVLEHLRERGARVWIVGKPGLLTGVGPLRVLRWLRRERFDAAVTFLFISDTLGRGLAHAAGVPRVISSLRARNVHYARWQRGLARWTMRWADAVVINSGQFRAHALSAEGAPADRLHVIPNGVAVDARAAADRASVRAELGIADSERLIGSVGRLVYQKGFDLLLLALSCLPRADTRLLLVGSGPDEEKLRHRASMFGLSERVSFLGYRRDVPRLLRGLDLYVQPSRYEGMPNALLEAMAAGCPVVASAVDGNLELIEDGRQGWLVPAGDDVALGNTILAALSDPVEACRRGAAARQRATDTFSLEAMVAAWEGVLRGEGSPRPARMGPNGRRARQWS